MKRLRRRQRWPVAAAAATCLVVVIAFGVSRLTSHVSAVPLRTLVSRQPDYIGHAVTTTGWVRRFTDPDGSAYYMLTDRAADRLVLQPAASARAERGREVMVTGRFVFKPGTGRTLVVRRLSPSQK